MSLHPHPATAHAHAPPSGFIQKWIFSKDHKIIGIQYFLLAFLSVFLGMGMSLLMRAQLGWPNQMWPGLAKLFPKGIADGVFSPEFYLSMVTMHGTMMVFFVLTTAPMGGFGNYFLPIQIGTNDMAFPTLNMLSFWTTFAGFLTLVSALFVEGGAPLGGWTGYAPLSALGEIAGPGQGMGLNLWVISIAILCMGSLLGALNLLATTLMMRKKGMTMIRMALTLWDDLVIAV